MSDTKKKEFTAKEKLQGFITWLSLSIHKMNDEQAGKLLKKLEQLLGVKLGVKPEEKPDE